MEWNLKNLERLSTWIRSGKLHGFRLALFQTISFDKESRRFFQEGFPDETQKDELIHLVDKQQNPPEPETNP